MLEPNANPAAKAFQEAMFKQGIPLAAFEVDDIEAEANRLKNHGVKFTMDPKQQGPVTLAIFSDTCGLRGELHVTWEEGTWAAWLHDLLQPLLQQILVSDPRRNALLKEGNKSDKVDARKLADLPPISRASG